MKRKIILLTLTLIAVCFQALAASVPKYQFTHAGNYPGAIDTYPEGVSLSQIVGYYVPQGNGATPAGYIQTGGKFVTAQPAGSAASYLFAINSSGLAAGEYCEPCIGTTWSTHGYTYDSSTVATATIDFPGARTTAAFGISDDGVIVGGFCLVRETCFSGLVFSSPLEFIEDHGLFTQLDYPGGFSTTAFGVNRARTIVGTYLKGGIQHSFTYQGGMYASLDYPGAKWTTATAINNSGVIAGTYVDAQAHAFGFLYYQGQFTQISVSTGPTQVKGINSRNDLVGTWFASTTPWASKRS